MHHTFKIAINIPLTVSSALSTCNRPLNRSSLSQPHIHVCVYHLLCMCVFVGNTIQLVQSESQIELRCVESEKALCLAAHCLQWRHQLCSHLGQWRHCQRSDVCFQPQAVCPVKIYAQCYTASGSTGKRHGMINSILKQNTVCTSVVTQTWPNVLVLLDITQFSAQFFLKSWKVSQHRENYMRKKIVVKHVQGEVDKTISWQLDPVTSFANGIKMLRSMEGKLAPGEHKDSLNGWRDP